MKKYSFFAFCLILCSCPSEDNGDDCCLSNRGGNCCGIPPPLDTIKLSSKELRFNVEGGVDSITTEGEDWCMSTLIIGDTVVPLHADGYYVKGEDGYEYEHVYEHAYEPVVISKKEESGCDVITRIETPWFSISKPNSEKLLFSVGKNETGKERMFWVDISSTNSIDTAVTINQSAE